MQRRQRSAEFNPRPMSRKYRNPINLRRMPFNCDAFFGNADHFPLRSAPHRCPYRPDEQPDFQSRERQHRPEPLHGEEGRDRERRAAQGRNECSRTPRRQRTMRSQFEAAHSRFRPRHGIRLRIRRHAVVHACHRRLPRKPPREGRQCYRRCKLRRNAQITDGKGFFKSAHGGDDGFSAAIPDIAECIVWLLRQRSDGKQPMLRRGGSASPDR